MAYLIICIALSLLVALSHEAVVNCTLTQGKATIDLNSLVLPVGSNYKFHDERALQDGSFNQTYLYLVSSLVFI